MGQILSSRAGSQVAEAPATEPKNKPESDSKPEPEPEHKPEHQPEPEQKRVGEQPDSPGSDCTIFTMEPPSPDEAEVDAKNDDDDDADEASASVSPADDDSESPDIEELKISAFGGASGTIIEKPDWDVEGAAEKVYNACKGLGTTEADITDVVCSINNGQRQVLREKFLAMYGEDLMDRLKSELNGRFQDLIIGLMTPRDEYLADWLRWSLQGAGTEEDTLIEVLCCRTNDEIERVKAAYKKKYERDLDDDIESDLGGQFQKLIRAVLACGRDESGSVDRDLAKSDAQELFDAGAAQWGTDESKFNAILCTRSYPHLRQVFKIYEELSGADITEAIDAEFTGDVQAGLLAIVAAVRDPATYYATKLQSALAGAGTRDNILIRIIVTRSEVDLKDIKDAFAAKYEESLADKVAADTRGDYEEALLKIIG